MKWEARCTVITRPVGHHHSAIPRPKNIDLDDADEEDVDKCEPDDHKEDFDVEMNSLIWTWEPSL